MNVLWEEKKECQNQKKIKHAKYTLNKQILTWEISIASMAGVNHLCAPASSTRVAMRVWMYFNRIWKKRTRKIKINKNQHIKQKSKSKFRAFQTTKKIKTTKTKTSRHTFKSCINKGVSSLYRREKWAKKSIVFFTWCGGICFFLALGVTRASMLSLGIRDLIRLSDSSSVVQSGKKKMRKVSTWRNS